MAKPGQCCQSRPVKSFDSDMVGLSIRIIQDKDFRDQMGLEVIFGVEIQFVRIIRQEEEACVISAGVGS
jgi:hypothetical protein